jgi:hypothetical protein
MQSETSIRVNKIKSDEIAAKVEAFKAKGGQVYRAAIGESAVKEKFVHSAVKREESYKKRHGHKCARQSD